MFNIDVRDSIRQSGFRNYEVAQEIGITESSLSCLLSRKEMTEERKAQIIQIVAGMMDKRYKAIQQAAQGGIPLHNN